MLATHHWANQYPPLNIRGELKQSVQDFQVTEELGYEPIGEGEHIYLWVEKASLNTAYVAEQIAKFSGLPLRAVSYAGRKDKHALTKQWFGVHLPGKKALDWQAMDLAGVNILQAIRHNKKLRTGVLKGNTFDITLRNVSSLTGIEERLQAIHQNGVPNYYGQQRFGDTRHDPRGGNLALAEKLLNGETIRNRNKRSMSISALRSWLFNEFIHDRLENNTLCKALAGDVMQLAGSQSFFCAETIDDTVLKRIAEQDIYPTAPLWGTGIVASMKDVLKTESELAKQHDLITQTLAALGLKQERRALRLYPKNMHWTIEGFTVKLSFSLPSGAFATSVLREVLEVYQQDTYTL